VWHLQRFHVLTAKQFAAPVPCCATQALNTFVPHRAIARGDGGHDYPRGMIGAMIDIPIAHHDGNNFANRDTIANLHVRDPRGLYLWRQTQRSQSTLQVSCPSTVVCWMILPLNALRMRANGGTDVAALSRWQGSVSQRDLMPREDA